MKYVILRRVIGKHYECPDAMLGFSAAATVDARTAEHAMEVARRKGFVAPVVQAEDKFLEPPPQTLMHKHGDKWHRTTEKVV